MAKDKKPKLPSFTSPKGIAVFPKLVEPDYGTKDYPKPDGEFSLKLRMSMAEAEAWLDARNKDGKTLRSIIEEAHREGEREFGNLDVANRKKLKEATEDEFFATIYDKETEEPTGEVELKLKMRHSGEFRDGPKKGQRWSRRLPLFDAFGQQITGSINVWGGSIVKASFAVKPYFIPATGHYGVSKYLSAVQIIKLVANGTAQSADSYGFGEEDGGFGYDPEDFADGGQAESKADTSSDNQVGEEDF